MFSFKIVRITTFIVKSNIKTSNQIFLELVNTMKKYQQNKRNQYTNFLCIERFISHKNSYSDRGRYLARFNKVFYRLSIIQCKVQEIYNNKYCVKVIYAEN